LTQASLLQAEPDWISVRDDKRLYVAASIFRQQRPALSPRTVTKLGYFCHTALQKDGFLWSEYSIVLSIKKKQAILNIL
jgi:hypothetical protein